MQRDSSQVHTSPVRKLSDKVVYLAQKVSIRHEIVLHSLIDFFEYNIGSK